MSQGGTIRYKRPKSDPKTWAWAYALIAPTIIGLCVLNIYPFFYTIYLSLLKYHPWQLFLLLIPAELLVYFSFRIRNRR